MLLFLFTDKMMISTLMLTALMASSSTMALEDLDKTPLEGLVASSNPVLKDHSIIYSDPDSVRSNEYASEATFNPRGMHHVYTITHTFLDLIQREKVLPDSLKASVILETPPSQLPHLLHDHWQELLLQYIGIVTVSVCGILMALAIPVAGRSSSLFSVVLNKILINFFFRLLRLLLPMCWQMWRLS